MKSPSKNKIRHPIHSNIITAALTASLYCSHDPTRQLVISSRAQCLLQMLSAASRLPIPSCFSCPARWKKRRSLEEKFTEQFSASARPAAPSPDFATETVPAGPCSKALPRSFNALVLSAYLCRRLQLQPRPAAQPLEDEHSTANAGSRGCGASLLPAQFLLGPPAAGTPLYAAPPPWQAN